MRLAKAATLAALTLSTVALTLPHAAVAQADRPRPATVSVMGTGEAELKPNFANLIVAVSTQADTVAQAAEANRAASEKVLARLQAIGVKKEDIRTLNFQVFRSYEPENSSEARKTRIPKFTANHQLRIKTTDLDGVGKLAGEILASGDMLFQSVSFGLDRQEEGEDKAREAAVKDAKRQAELYANAAGAGLGRLMEIRDGSAQPFQMEASDMRMMAAAKATPDAMPIVPPATLRYRANVQIVWELTVKP